MRTTLAIGSLLATALLLSGTSLALIETASMAEGFAARAADAQLGVAQDGLATANFILDLEAHAAMEGASCLAADALACPDYLVAA